MTLNGVGSYSLIEAKDYMFVESTSRTKNMATTFFIAEVEGNYSVILGRDWIHASQCVPSNLHQMSIRWVGDNVEIVHADTSTCMAMVDAPVLWTCDSAKCLTR